MEVLVVAHHRNHHEYCGRNRGHGSKKFKSFNSPNYRAVSCRTFQSGERLRTSRYSIATPVTKGAFTASLSPDDPSSSFNKNRGTSKRVAKCSTVPVSIKSKFKNKERGFHFSDLWAGPTYSNSPPPSCLPMPKFFVQPNRTVSLEFPTMVSQFNLHPTAKYAPVSCSCDGRTSPNDLFENNLFEAADSATNTLRRILNLEIPDE